MSAELNVRFRVANRCRLMAPSGNDERLSWVDFVWSALRIEIEKSSPWANGSIRPKAEWLLRNKSAGIAHLQHQSMPAY